MARQLIYGNEIVGFTPSSGIITAKGYVPLPKLLSIVNSTLNTPIYSFADPDTTATVSYDAVAHETTFNVSYNTVGMGTEDKLQIYYEKEDIEISPSKFLIDPASKLRVSQPESLIDTDFEYGIQSTKWETVKLVNNIPTAYSSGIPEESFEALSIKVDQGNDFVTVDTSEPHNLVIGAVVDIQGLKDPKYEGTFVVRDITDANTFAYKIPFKSPKTTQLETEFTLIYPGSFYTGASIDVLDVQTSTGAASSLTVTIDNIPGIINNSKLFLKKSRATKRYAVQSPTDITAWAELQYQTTIPNSGTGVAITANPTNTYLTQVPIIEDDWIGNEEYNFDTTDITTGTSVRPFRLRKDIQVGLAKTLRLEEDDVVIYYTPRGNTHPGPGISSYHPYRVTGVAYTGSNSEYMSISIARDFNDPALSVSSVGTTTFGNHRFIKANGGRITQLDQRGTITFSKPHGLKYGDKVCFFSKWDQFDYNYAWWYGYYYGVSGISTVRGNWSSSNYREYTVSTILNTSQVRIPEAAYRTYRYYWWGWWWYWYRWYYFGRRYYYYYWWYYWYAGYNYTFYQNDDRLVSLAKIQPHPLNNSVYLTQDAGFSTTNYKSAQTVRYTIGTQGSLGTIQGLSANTDYLVREIKSDLGSNWYQFYRFTDGYLSSPIKINIRNPESTFRTTGGYHKFNSSLLKDDACTIKITEPARGDLANNQRIRYTTATGTPIGGLTASTNYFVKSDDNLIANTQFRLANEQGTLDVTNFSYSGGNRSTATITVVSGAAHTCGVRPYGFIQLSGYEGPASENLLIQGLHQVVGIETSYFYYYYYTRRYRKRWRRRYYWYYYRRYIVTRRNPLTYITVSVPTTKNRLNVYYKDITTTPVKLCGIVSFTSSGGIGTHYISVDTDGAADDTYTVTDAVSNQFVLNTTVEIPEVVNGLSGGDTSRVGIGSNWIKIPDHRLADGTKVTYSSQGFAAIGPLVNGGEYFVRTLDGDHIGLSTQQSLALNRLNDPTNTNLITITSLGSTTQHLFTSRSVKGFITGEGTVGVTTTSNLVSGTNTKFYSDFSNGDTFRIYTTKATTGPGSYFESRIVQVKSNTSIKLETEPTFETQNAKYFIPTRFYALSESKVIHRPFDGAVQMSSGLVPNTQLIRQTRRYFRYQAGKGIQCSMAINFNPTFDIDAIKIDGQIGVSTNIIVQTKFPHGISTFAPLDDYQRFQILNCDYPKELNDEYRIVQVIDDFNVKIQTATPLTDSKIEGFPQFNLTGWRDGLLKCGMFDDQNGFFFQFDGEILSVVRRSNTQQLAGRFSVETGKHLVRASGGKLTTQISPANRVIIRGQTYKVTRILDDDLMYVQPAYRSKTMSNVVASKVIDTIIPQEEWNIDRMDGTGVSGYKIDTNRIQMVFMDYSWYGAGTIRFGMKTQMGEVKYCHEFIHNNKFTEAYFRSGNLPVRYEVETLDDPYFGPSLYHWGVSVIMDGRFDQDKVYHFSADSKVLPFTNGGIANYNGVVPTGRTSIGSTVITSINRTEGQILAVGQYITSPTAGTFEPDTRITAIEVDTTSNATRYTDTYRLFVDKDALATRSTNTALYAYSGTAETLKEFIPLVTIRLAPSVDNSTTGNIGYREIINRMQIILKSANVLTSHDCEVNLVVNAKLANDDYEEVGSPSLSQMYRHEIGDTFSSGQVVYSFRAQGGGAFDGISLKRGLNGTTVDLSDVAVLGNSVLGGDSIYPDGPDVLTLAVRPIDTSLIRGSAPFIVSGRLTWIETQA